MVLCGACVLAARTTSAQSPTVSGAFSVEPATLVSLGFDWRISGDDNRNARVDVTFRKRGESNWRPALPLLRLQREVINGVVPGPNPTPNLLRSPFDYVVPNMFSGSILNLQPDTEYECRFVLADPDGVTGDTTKTVTVRTRPEPQEIVAMCRSLRK